MPMTRNRLLLSPVALALLCYSSVATADVVVEGQHAVKGEPVSIRVTDADGHGEPDEPLSRFFTQMPAWRKTLR